jgi:hypothetical protein
MDNNSESVPLFSSTTARTLWVIAVAVAGFTLVLNLWGWARRGYDWTALLGTVGILLLVVSYVIGRSRGRLYLVLQMIAIGLLIADLSLMLR